MRAISSPFSSTWSSTMPFRGSAGASESGKRSGRALMVSQIGQRISSSKLKKVSGMPQ